MTNFTSSFLGWSSGLLLAAIILLTTTLQDLGPIKLDPVITAQSETSNDELHTERDWQLMLAPKYNAEVEVRLWDRTRVDLVNGEYAIEIDFAHKWAEAIGQALWYAELTSKKPGIILIVKTTLEDEARYVYRCQAVCAKHGIKLWVESQ